MMLEGRVAVVTGAGSGIGRATAVRFAHEGATVVVNDVGQAAADETVAMLEGEGHLALAADVSDPDAVGAMFREVGSRLGRVDVLVNNAGIAEGTPGELNEVQERVHAQVAEVAAGTRDGVRMDFTLNLSDESWERMQRVNLWSQFYCTRAALPLMLPGGRGSIVNISSVNGVMNPGVVHYSAAKAGVIGLTRALSAELGPCGIRVNAICPGTTDTPMYAGANTETLRATLLAQIPLGRLADPSEMASAILFLASDDSSYVNGQWLSPNGGWLV